MSTAPVRLTPKNLGGARRYYVTDWLVPMWRRVDWPSVGEFIFWHAIAGWARGSDAAADNALTSVRTGRVRSLGNRSRELWTFIHQAIQPLVRRHRDPLTLLDTEVVNLFHHLDTIKHIGPKIAAFTLRDLSFLRDTQGGGDRWFEQLPGASQAVFIPIDQHVYRAARQAKASATAAHHSLIDIQNDVDLHSKVGRDLALWAKKRSFDPRVVNVFWFSYGRGDIDENGNPMPEEE